MHYLVEYQTFNNKEELNKAVYTHIKRNSPDLNETARTALKMIARYAVKFAGVAHLKAATVADLIGKSVKTARRAINKLAELGIVEKVATTRRVNGGKGANIIVIQPIKNNDDQSTVSSREHAEKPTDNSEETRNSVNEPSNLIKRINKSTLQDTDNAVPSAAFRQSLPSEIYNVMAPYFNADELYKYYGVLLRAKRSIDPTVTIEEDSKPFTDTFLNAVYKYKRGKVRNLANYLYTAWQSATAYVSRKRAAANHGEQSYLHYDWLAE